MVILLHREDVYERESTRPGEADLIVAKHRNGPDPRHHRRVPGPLLPVRRHGARLSAAGDAGRRECRRSSGSDGTGEGEQRARRAGPGPRRAAGPPAPGCGPVPRRPWVGAATAAVTSTAPAVPSAATQTPADPGDCHSAPPAGDHGGAVDDRDQRGDAARVRVVGRGPVLGADPGQRRVDQHGHRRLEAGVQRRSRPAGRRSTPDTARQSPVEAVAPWMRTRVVISGWSEVRSTSALSSST